MKISLFTVYYILKKISVCMCMSILFLELRGHFTGVGSPTCGSCGLNSGCQAAIFSILKFSVLKNESEEEPGDKP